MPIKNENGDIINLPPLEELLAKRGIHKSKDYDDYQDYIAEQQSKLKVGLLGLNRIPLQGNIHLALNRITKICRFHK